MRIRLEVVHLISGRARIKVGSEFDPAIFFVVVEAALNDIDEIERAELNPRAKSLTMYFRDGHDFNMILDKLRSVLQTITSDPSFAERIEEIEYALKYSHRASVDVVVRDKILSVSRNLDHSVRKVTGNVIDMKTLLPVSSFTAGIATLAVAPALPTPTWLVLLIFGFTAFHITAAPAGEDSRHAQAVNYSELIEHNEPKLLDSGE